MEKAQGDSEKHINKWFGLVSMTLRKLDRNQQLLYIAFSIPSLALT